VQAHAIAKYIRVSPKKLRRICNVIRNKDLVGAINVVTHMQQSNARYILKILNSVKANALVKDPNITSADLWITELKVDMGPSFMRWRPRARGRAYPILKRTSHISVTVSNEV